MQDIIGITLMVIGMILVAHCSAVWSQGKAALRSKGYPVDYFWNHDRDFGMIDKAVSEETDPIERDHLRMIQKRMKSIWIIAPIGVITFFLGVFLGPLV